MLNQATILANGLTDFNLGRKAALRSLVWFGFGYHDAHQDGTDAAYMRDLKNLLTESGAHKSEVHAKAKIAANVGKAFAGLFQAELVSDWESPAAFIQACFNVAQASGATSVKRLDDWAIHGNADHAAAVTKQKADERAAEKSTETSEALAQVQGIETSPLDFDAVSEPVAASEPETVEEIDAGELSTLSDDDLNTLAQAVASEIARRAEIALNVAA